MAEIELDKNSDWPTYSSVCSFCRHLISSVPSQRQALCAAFPDGIPDEIWMGENKHQEAYPGDHGIRFAPRPDADPEALKREGLA